jgi:cytochrome b561
MKSAPSGYSGLQIALHWAIAAFIIFQLFVHDGMSDAFDDWIDGNEIDREDFGWAVLHIAVGISVLVLAVIRTGIRLRRGVPAPHRDKPAAIIWFANATHYALYAFMF